ncbi:MAG TPA: hypothetical protein VJ898_06135 [Natrialbaceae archaeon]|nr:hypothetical protein [Natrialbaceae archaeon]
MSLAERTREAARAHPFLLHGLQAGVVNYTAAARFLDVDGEIDAVATALRRYADDLEPADERECDARVTMHRGVGPVGDGTGEDEPLLAVDGTPVVEDDGSDTAILATGVVPPTALAHVLDRLLVEGIDPVAAGVAGDALVVVVEGRDGVDALRVVEDGLASVPDR